MTSEPLPRQIKLRYPGRCASCERELAKGSTALHDAAAKTVTCLECAVVTVEAVVSAEADNAAPPTEPLTPAPSLDHGTAGASAAREYDRRSAKREASIRAAHPRIGGLILALSDDPQSTKAWESGAKGESVVGAKLDSLADDGVIALHDRAIPRSRANIDHIAVAPTGVYVIDAKRYRDKRPTLRTEGGLFRARTERLMIGSRDGSSLVTGVHKQVGLVQAALEAGGAGDVPLRGVLCFVDADWPLFGTGFTVDGLDVLSPKRLLARLRATGEAPAVDCERIAALLARSFPPA